MDQQRTSSFTMSLMLVVQTISAVLIIAGTAGADPSGESIALRSVIDKAHEVDDDDNAVIVEASSDLGARLESRDGRGILWNGVSGAEGCFTSKGEFGRCTSFKECYPYFKIPDLGALDGWVLGVYDTCSYTLQNGESSFGICCSNIFPVVTPPSDDTSNPVIDDVKQPRPQWPISNWPPPIITHPPDHTIPPLPTHPPYPGIPTATTEKPVRPTPQKPGVGTTWPTKKPAWWPGLPTTPPTIGKPPGTIPGIPNAQCGRKNGNQDQERIVGGQNAEVNEWPWIAVLFNSGRQFCGGSLIDNVHILTAAHCVANMNPWDVSRLTVHLGDHNIRTTAEVQHVSRRVKKLTRHSGFNSRTLYNDIALLTLSAPVDFSNQINPICLPSGSQVYSGKTSTVIGWGSLRENGPQPAILQKVSVPIWPNSECKVKYGGAAPGGIIDSFICAGRSGMDSCSGDSGGPLMVHEGHWVQVGVVSWGIGCGKGRYPGVYTRVTSFLPWIRKNIK